MNSISSLNLIYLPSLKNELINESSITLPSFNELLINLNFFNFNIFY